MPRWPVGRHRDPEQFCLGRFSVASWSHSLLPFVGEACVRKTREVTYGVPAFVLQSLAVDINPD